jgi:hypothetical protein
MGRTCSSLSQGRKKNISTANLLSSIFSGGLQCGAKCGSDILVEWHVPTVRGRTCYSCLRTGYCSRVRQPSNLAVLACVDSGRSKAYLNLAEGNRGCPRAPGTTKRVRNSLPRFQCVSAKVQLFRQHTRHSSTHVKKQQNPGLPLTGPHDKVLPATPDCWEYRLLPCPIGLEFGLLTPA